MKKNHHVVKVFVVMPQPVLHSITASSYLVLLDQLSFDNQLLKNYEQKTIYVLFI